MEKCLNCGGPMQDGQCTYCGKKEAEMTSEQEVAENTGSKSKMVALLLCIFLGFLGVHHFYTGKIGMGILFLLTCGIFCIGWIVDIVRIATGSFRDKEQRLLV